MPPARRPPRPAKPNLAGETPPPPPWPACVSESLADPLDGRRIEFSERHLQAVWFDAALRPGALRPGALRTERGEPVAVEQPGRWNLEAGPDFRDAVLRLGADGRRLAGDVEIHVRASDWHRHGHAHDPAYAGVVAHVTYYPGLLPAGSLPPECRQIALRDGLAANPFFSFDSLDLTAYPYALREPETPCARILGAKTPEAVAVLLEAAGLRRIRSKAARLADALPALGPGQTLYAALMAALGYKHNRGPFRYLAEQIPLADLKALAAGDALNAYAVFMGAAGLLPAQAPARWPAESRAFVRRLWDTWWKHQAAWSGRALSRRDWKLSGLRPPNHPQRRLMLAALLFVGQPDLARRLAAIRTDCPDAALAEMAALLQPGPGPFWARRLSLSGPPRAAPVALLGKARTAAILANVLVPFLAAAGNREVLEPDWLRRLPPEDDNQVLRQAARALLGPDHNPALYRSGLRQQGLLQIFHEFCLNDRSGCARCALPGLLAAAPRRA